MRSADAHIDTGRVVHERVTLRRGQPGVGHELVVELLDDGVP
jgi:hypothetical protein